MAEKVGEVYLEIGAIMGAFETALVSAKKKALELEQQFKKTSSNITKVAESMNAAGKKMSTFITLPILGIAAASLKSAASMEQAAISFEVLLGSAGKAQAMLKEIEAFANTTPFAFPDLADSAKMMLNFGIAAEDIMPNLKMLGDISGGNAEKLQSLSLVFAQIASNGKLMGQDLLQMINAGFNPLTEIAKKTGKSMAVLRKEMEDGAISFDMVQDAMKAATSEGGQFFGMMDKQGKSLSGMMSTLIDNITALARSIVSVLLPPIKSIIDGITSFIDSFGKLDESTKVIILTITGLVAAIGPFLIITGKMILAYQSALAVGAAFKAGMALQAAATGASTAALAANKIAIVAATVAQRAFNLAAKANPWVLLATAIIAGTAAIAGLVKSLMSGASAASRAAEEKRKLADNMERLKAITSETSQAYDGYIAQMKEDNKSRKQIISFLQTQIKMLQLVKTAQIDYSSKQATQAQIDAINQKIDALKKEEKQQKKTNAASASDAWLKAKQAAVDKWSAYNDTFMKSELELAEYAYKKDQSELDAAYNRKLITTDMYYQASKNKQQEYENAKTKIQADAEKRRSEMAIGALNTASNYTNQVASLVSQYYSNQIAEVENSKNKQIDALDEWYNTQKEALKDQYGDTKEYKKAVEKLDEEKTKKEDAINAESAKKELKLKREAAQREKAFNIASTIMNTAAAAIASYRALAGIPIVGPALGAAAAAAITALGAAQVALIQQTPLPTAAEGIYAESPYIGGEAGPELAFPLSSERGKKAISLLADGVINSIASRQNQANQATVTNAEPTESKQSGTVYLDGSLVGRWISSGSQNGLFTIDSRVVVT